MELLEGLKIRITRLYWICDSYKKNINQLIIFIQFILGKTNTALIVEVNMYVKKIKVSMLLKTFIVG